MSRVELGRIRQMLKKELRQIFRDWRMKRIIFVAPLIQLIVFGYAVNTDIRDTALFVVDLDQSADSRQLLDALTASGYFRTVARSDRPAALLSALDAGDAIVGVQIPSDFSRDLRSGKSPAVQLLVDGTNSNTATVAQANAVRIVQGFATRFAASSGATPPGGVDLRIRAWHNPDLASRVYNVPAVVGVILMMMCLLLTAMSVVREREMGTLEQLMVTPLSPRGLLLGKTLPVALIALMDLALIATVAVFWFDVPFRGNPFVLLVAALLYILTGLALGLLISTVAQTQQEALMVMFFFFLPAITLSGFMFPIFTMPEAFQWLTLANPIRPFIEIVRGVFLKADGFTDLRDQYLLLLAMTGLSLLAAGWRMRKSLSV